METPTQTTLLAAVEAKIAETMKARDAVASNAYKAIKAELVKSRHSEKPAPEIQILLKMQAQRKESIELYTAANRDDLAYVEKRELEIIESFLPAPVSDEDIAAYAAEIANRTENLSMKDMKNILAEVKKKYPAASGALVSKVVKDLCGK